MQLTNQNCETCLRQILQWNYSFVLNWFCLDMWVRVAQRWTFYTFGLVGAKVDENPPVLSFAYPIEFRKKRKRNHVSLRAHDKGEKRVCSKVKWCKRGGCSTFRVAFWKHSFQRLDSDWIYNWLMSHWKVLQTHQKDWLGKNFMTKLSRCKLRTNFKGPNIASSWLQNFVVGLVTAFLKVSTKTKRLR